MTTKLTELPNIIDMYATIDKIKELTLRKLILEIKIKDSVSDITRLAMTSEEYFVNNKPPSMAFVDKTYVFSGFSGELLPPRQELASIISDLEHTRLTFDLDNSRIQVWRTQSANERKVVD